MSGALSSACAVWLRLLVGVSDCGPSQKMPEKAGWKFDASIWTRNDPAPTLGKLNWPKASVVVVAAVLPSLRSKARRTLGSPSSSGKTAEMLVGFEMEKSRHTRPVTAPAMGAGRRAGRAPRVVSVSTLMPVRPIRTVPPALTVVLLSSVPCGRATTPLVASEAAVVPAASGYAPGGWNQSSTVSMMAFKTPT